MIEQKLTALLISEYKRHPLSQVQDYYKLVYQSVWGAEHNISDYDKVFSILVNDMVQLKGRKDLPLYYTIGLDNELMRINLSRCKFENINAEQIMHIFYEGARNFISKYDDYFEYMLDLMSSILLEPPFNLKSVNEFLNRMRDINYPPSHHSKIYKDLYDPQYRLIPIKLLSNLKINV